MPKFRKGSPEAKAYMAHLRSLRGHGRGGCGKKRLRGGWGRGSATTSIYVELLSNWLRSMRSFLAGELNSRSYKSFRTLAFAQMRRIGFTDDIIRFLEYLIREMPNADARQLLALAVRTLDRTTNRYSRNKFAQYLRNGDEDERTFARAYHDASMDHITDMLLGRFVRSLEEEGPEEERINYQNINANDIDPDYGFEPPPPIPKRPRRG